eukprot:10720427-Heterocapsa_arctica.AAC.1
MATAPQRTGDGPWERDGYPPHRQGKLPRNDKPRLRYCRTCGMPFIAVPDQWTGYMHTNCCSQCTRTGGHRHTPRCRNRTEAERL